GPGALIADGESGLLVPLEEAPAGLARALARLAGDPDLRARLAAGGRRAYEAGFTEAAVVGRYLDFFQRTRARCAASPG
ncbi:MAG: glycosyltransferase, partial [Stellaceae bacterium]